MGAGLPLPVLKLKAAELTAKNKQGNKQPGRERASWRGDKVSMAGTEVKRHDA
jgi:hypothetical protein